MIDFVIVSSDLRLQQGEVWGVFRSASGKLFGASGGGKIQAVYSKDGTWLTSTEEVVGLWKEHFEETPESH